MNKFCFAVRLFVCLHWIKTASDAHIHNDEVKNNDKWAHGTSRSWTPSTRQNGAQIDRQPFRMISPQRLFPYIIFLCIIQATFDSDASQLLLVASTVPVQCFSDRTTVTEPKQNHAIDVPYFDYSQWSNIHTGVWLRLLMLMTRRKPLRFICIEKPLFIV